MELPRSENVSYVSLHIEDCNSHFMMLSTIPYPVKIDVCFIRVVERNLPFFISHNGESSLFSLLGSLIGVIIVS